MWAISIPAILRTLSKRQASIAILPIEYKIKYEKKITPSFIPVIFLITKNNIKNTAISHKDSYKNAG